MKPVRFLSVMFFSLRNYKQAYANLMEVRASDANMLEVKTVAGFINYKVILFYYYCKRPFLSQNQFTTLLLGLQVDHFDY